MNEQTRKMILDWMRKIHQLEYAHRFESISYAQMEKYFGISAFVFATLITFSYQFPKADTEVFEQVCFIFRPDFLIPLASTIVAILTGLITFLKPSERAETHKKTANNYEKLRHRIELILTGNFLSNDLDKELNNVREEWENLDAINVSDKYFKKGKEKAQSFNKYPKELDFLEDVN